MPSSRKPKRRKPEIRVALSLVSRERIAALPAEDQAQLAYDTFGAMADRLTDFGFAPDLIATAVSDLGHELSRLDGSPARVFKIRDIRKKDR
jgi:hypothetical protein